MVITREKAKKGFIIRALDVVGRVGDGLPDPAAIFLILIDIAIVLSAICTALGVSVACNLLDNASGETPQKTMQAVNLLAPDSIRHTIITMVSNFTGFFALGTMFTIMIGVGVADDTGFMSALLCKTVASTPKAFVTTVVVFLGIMSNIASSTGYVVLVPLRAILFMAFRCHPIVGLAVALAGVSGGWSANLLIGASDPMFADMSTQAVQMIDPGCTVLPVCNQYFMIASTFLITIIRTIATDKLIEPRLVPYVSDTSEIARNIAENKKCDMCWAGITALTYVIFMTVLVAPSNGLLRNPEAHAFLIPPFMSGIIFFMMLLSLFPDLAYSIGTGTVKSDRDVVALMNKTIAGLTSFMVLIFFATQFTACFNYPNLGTIISVSGANFLQSVEFVGLPPTICFIILTTPINVFITVDSTEWAITTPILVPMFMRSDLSPEPTQIAYRIDDSSTNITAPLVPFFVLTVTLFQKYDKKAGVGSVISTMLPYSLASPIGRTIVLVIWHLLGLPLGPGSSIFY